MAEEAKKNDQQQPQPEKKGSFLTKVIVVLLVLILGFGGFLMFQHSSNTGKKPWEWTGDDWKSFWGFAQGESTDLGTKGVEKAKAAGAKVKEWIGDLDKLWAKAREASGGATTVGASGGTGASDAECLANYRGGSQDLGEAIALYKEAQQLDIGSAASGKGPNMAEGAKKHAEALAKFDSAIAKLEKAEELDPKVDAEIDDLIEATKNHRTACYERLND